MDKFNKDSLYIPQGIKHNSEKFKGIPDEHLKNIALVLVVFAVFDVLILIMTKNTPIAFGAFVVEFVAVGLYFKRDENTNISIADQLRYMSRFSKSQKIYRYKALKEWFY